MTAGKVYDGRTRCPVSHYARQVTTGKIVACDLVKLACERHLKDLESCHALGLYFDRGAAEHAISKFEIFRHSKGEWGGQLIRLSDWQKFCVGSIYGWKRADGTRRFRSFYIEVPRKNGKSTLGGAFCNYMLYFDRELGAEVYTAATKKDQARIVYNEAVNMLRKLPPRYEIRRKLTILSHKVEYQSTASFMMPLSADAHTMDGLNPHFIIIDELHAHKTRAVFDVLNTAMGARRQPLLGSITTSGWDRNSVCWQQHEYGVNILKGVQEDDSLFAFICTIDEGDDPFDESTWIKANPNLGITPKLDYMRAQALRAKQMPSEYNAFLRLHLNVWTEQADRWINLSDWDECREDYAPEDLLGLPCYGALDMSSTQDISCYSLTFPPANENDTWKVLHWFFVPRENILERARRDQVDYSVWVRQGYIEATEGNVVDYNFVQKRIEEINEKFNVVESAYDRWNTTQMITNLTDEGLEMVSFGQGYASMSAPTKVLGDLIVSKRIAHNGNPVLRWMVSNVAVTQDPAGNIKPDKSRSSEKIDGVVTLVMGIGIAQVAEKPQESSVTRDGLLIL